MSQVQTDRTLVPRVGGSVPTSRLLQININLVNPPCDVNCLFCIMHFQTGRFAYTQCYAWRENDCEGWTEIDFLSFSSFLLPILTNTHLSIIPIITLFMFIFMIFYPIDNVRNLFSIIWNVLSIISDMIPPIFPSG